MQFELLAKKTSRILMRRAMLSRSSEEIIYVNEFNFCYLFQKYFSSFILTLISPHLIAASPLLGYGVCLLLDNQRACNIIHFFLRILHERRHRIQEVYQILPQTITQLSCCYLFQKYFSSFILT